MNWNGLIPALMGLFYLIYSVIQRSKANYYSKKFIKKHNMKLIKIEEYLKLQLISSMFVSGFNIVLGIFIIILNINDLYIFLGPLVLSVMNFWLMSHSKSKGYVYYS